MKLLRRTGRTPTFSVPLSSEMTLCVCAFLPSRCTISRSTLRNSWKMSSASLILTWNTWKSSRKVGCSRSKLEGAERSRRTRKQRMLNLPPKTMTMILMVQSALTTRPKLKKTASMTQISPMTTNSAQTMKKTTMARSRTPSTMSRWTKSQTKR